MHAMFYVLSFMMFNLFVFYQSDPIMVLLGMGPGFAFDDDDNYR